MQSARKRAGLGERCPGKCNACLSIAQRPLSALRPGPHSQSSPGLGQFHPGLVPCRTNPGLPCYLNPTHSTDGGISVRVGLDHLAERLGSLGG